jgi:hypothetical protein
MSKIDAFYTPPKLAAEMVRVCSGRPVVVADVTSGDGELLRAASQRWPKAKLIAADISRAALARLSATLKVDVASRCNFLSQRSRSQCAAFKNWSGKINLCLLNPPFSCRGGKRITVSTRLFSTNCSTAMAFLLNAFEYLHSDGEIVAILPAGVVASEKDDDAWRQLSKHATVTTVSQHDHRTFGDCYPTTSLVHIRRINGQDVTVLDDKKTPAQFPLPTRKPVVIYRGTIQMHSIPRGRMPLAHSTDLIGFRLILNGHRTKQGESGINGPFVAICRVGDPKKEKIALHYTQSQIGISDCILALKCSTKADANQLHTEMVANWLNLAGLYSGTGAKYITVSKLAGFVKQLGFPVVPHASAKWQMKRSINEPQPHTGLGSSRSLLHASDEN